jgi:hypothetical protein
LENNGLDQALKGNLKFKLTGSTDPIETISSSEPLLIDPFIDNYKKRKKLLQE